VLQGTAEEDGEELSGGDVDAQRELLGAGCSKRFFKARKGFQTLAAWAHATKSGRLKAAPALLQWRYNDDLVLLLVI
jgi:hypothetical protein